MDNPVTQSDLLKALDSLILAEEQNKLEDDDITVSRLSNKTGWNRRKAQKIIGEWESAGKLEFIGERREPLRGSMVKAWKVKDAPALP